jgi:hypothetical protein
MLRYQHGRNIGWQAGQQCLQRLHAAGGRADADDGSGGRQKMIEHGRSAGRFAPASRANPGAGGRLHFGDQLMT